MYIDDLMDSKLRGQIWQSVIISREERICFSIVLSVLMKQKEDVTKGRGSMVKCRETSSNGEGFMKIP